MRGYTGVILNEGPENERDPAKSYYRDELLEQTLRIGKKNNGYVRTRLLFKKSITIFNSF